MTWIIQDMLKHQALPNLKGIIGEPIKPLDLKYYFQSDNELILFDAKLLDGSTLPRDIICSRNGVIQGIPAAGTEIIQHYRVLITATNSAGETTNSLLSLEITQKEKKADDGTDYRSIAFRPLGSVSQTHKEEKSEPQNQPPDQAKNQEKSPLLHHQNLELKFSAPQQGTTQKHPHKETSLADAIKKTLEHMEPTDKP